LAGALAASKLNLPLAHVEAGARSFDRTMPEEINRIVADHVSDLLFCIAPSALDNLNDEGIHAGVHLVGDVMYDAVIANLQIARARSSILSRLDLRPKTFTLATVHRAANTKNGDNLRNIITAFNQADE